MNGVRALFFGAAVASLVACGSGASQSGPGDAGAGDDASVAGEGASSSGSGSSGGGSGSSSSGGSGGSSGASSGSSGSGSGGSSSGGPGDGGATGGGDAGSSSGACKRGIAANAAPSSALAPTASSPGVHWWYDWSNKGAAPPAGIEFVPMIWGSASLAGPVPAGSRFLLGFNEPNFKAQSNLTPQQAAADWPKVEALAKAAGILLVSPAVNFCGSASNPGGCSDPAVTDPYTWLKDFFAACSGCQVDYVAAHWYNCDLPSLRAYLEGNVSTGGGLQGFVQFGKPIWLTEFSCDGSHSVADQKAYMQAAVPYLESNPHVFRYSWFSAGPIPNAQLTTANGSLTDLGTTYASLPQSCP
jgi:hypothetical protein